VALYLASELPGDFRAAGPAEATAK
jgi:hypothetical protein